MNTTELTAKIKELETELEQMRNAFRNNASKFELLQNLLTSIGKELDGIKADVATFKAERKAQGQRSWNVEVGKY
jgi:chromosome segregation ATPase